MLYTRGWKQAMNESEAPSNRQAGVRVFNRPDLLASREAVCVYARDLAGCSVRVSGVEGFVDRNSFPSVVRARVTTCRC